MLLKNQLEQTGLEKRKLGEMFDLGDIVADPREGLSSSVVLSARLTVHVVAAEATQRAGMARLVFASGHHAEVYNDAGELVEHGPTGGIVLVHESGMLGAARVCRALSEQGLWLPVVGFGDEVDANRIVAGMKAGAMDYLVGPVSTDVMLAKLQECTGQAETLSKSRARRVEARAVMARLSDRERQVLTLLATGLSNKAMARDLGISPRTIEIHRMKMMAKIGATSGAHAARIWMEATGN